MATCVMMQNPTNGLIRRGYFGFSWTYLFFGWFVPLIRGELGVAALHFFFTLITCGLWQIVFAFFIQQAIHAPHAGKRLRAQRQAGRDGQCQNSLGCC